MQGLTVNSLIIMRIPERKQFVKYIKSPFEITHNPGLATRHLNIGIDAHFEDRWNDGDRISWTPWPSQMMWNCWALSCVNPCDTAPSYLSFLPVSGNGQYSLRRRSNAYWSSRGARVSSATASIALTFLQGFVWQEITSRTTYNWCPRDVTYDRGFRQFKQFDNVPQRRAGLLIDDILDLPDEPVIKYTAEFAAILSVKIYKRRNIYRNTCILLNIKWIRKVERKIFQ